jgi:hypothetical protein
MASRILKTGFGLNKHEAKHKTCGICMSVTGYTEGHTSIRISDSHWTIVGKPKFEATDAGTGTGRLLVDLQYQGGHRQDRDSGDVNVTLTDDGNLSDSTTAPVYYYDANGRRKKWWWPW